VVLVASFLVACSLCLALFVLMLWLDRPAPVDDGEPWETWWKDER